MLLLALFLCALAILFTLWASDALIADRRWLAFGSIIGAIACWTFAFASFDVASR
jgi:hypothetical protein